MVDTQGLSGSATFVDVLFGVTIAALFSGLNHQLGGVKVQLSDVLAAITIFVVVLRGFSTPRIAPPLTISLLAYLLLFCVSAFLVDTVNGLKESAQAVLIFSFLFVLFGYYRTHSATRLLAVGSFLIVAVLAYNIGWHVLHGFYTGWKHLNEPKAIFILLPMLLILLFNRFGHQRRALFVAASVIAGAIILLSGERKAYMFALVALIIWTGAASLRYLSAAALVVSLFLAAGVLDQTGYLNRQLGSFSNALNTRIELVSTSELFNERRPSTLSDAQREFTRRTAKSMWEKSPMFGIGTGGYAAAMREKYSIPAEFRVGIHGEFYRALYENGIVGLLLYVAFWIAVCASLIVSWGQLKQVEGGKLQRIKLLCTVMFLIYCSSEASKGLTVMSICALPFIFAVLPQCMPAQRLRRTLASPFTEHPH